MIALLLATAAFADPCEPDPQGGLADGPVAVPTRDGGLGLPHAACARDELAVRAAGWAVVDTPGFYGQIQADLAVDGRFAATPDTELFARVELVRWTSVIGALSSDALGTGHTALGVSHRLPVDRFALALNGELVLPTATGLYDHAFPFGADLGLAWAAGEDHWRTHGQVGVLGSLVPFGAGPTAPWGGAQVTAGGSWVPGRAFALVLDAEAGFGYTAPLELVTVAPGFRFAPSKKWGIELDVSVPLLGRDHLPLAAGQLRTRFSL